MHYFNFLFITVLLVFTGCKANDTISKTTKCSYDATSHVTKCQLRGYSKRGFTIYAPEVIAPTPPVIISIHGGGSNQDNGLRSTCPNGKLSHKQCLHHQATSAGFIVITPDGTPSRLSNSIRTWNAGGGIDNYRCASGYACKQNIDDIQYFDTMLSELKTVIDYDEQRVFTTGLSNGGAMSHRLACELSDKIRGIAAVGGANQFFTSHQCQPANPVAIMHIHGTADPCWKYNGGSPSCIVQGQRNKHHISVDSTISEWKQLLQCKSETVTTQLEDNVDDSSVTQQTSYQGCNEPLELLTIEGGGHTWPNGYQYFKPRLIGPVSRDWGSEMIVEFFRSLAARRE